MPTTRRDDSSSSGAPMVTWVRTRRMQGRAKQSIQFTWDFDRFCVLVSASYQRAGLSMRVTESVVSGALHSGVTLVTDSVEADRCGIVCLLMKSGLLDSGCQVCAWQQAQHVCNAIKVAPLTAA